MKLSERIARRLSRSEMKGYDMGWELTFLRFIPHINCATFFEFKCDLVTGGDHSPQFELSLTILNFCFFEIYWMNAYHEVEVDAEYMWTRVKVTE